MNKEAKIFLTFDYDGRVLEVRQEKSDRGVSFRVYENDKPLTGAVYSVSWDTLGDADVSNAFYPSSRILEELAEIARRDFIYWSDWRKKHKPSKGK